MDDAQVELVNDIVNKVKSQGLFDQFRKECGADVDTKPAYQNLKEKVEVAVETFLSSQEWRPDVNKIQLREKLRKNIKERKFMDTGLERIVDQVVNPKVNTSFHDTIEEVVYRTIGLEPPKKQNVPEMNAKQKPNTDTATLLPTDLESVSPDSVRSDDDKGPIGQTVEHIGYEVEIAYDSQLSDISGLTSDDEPNKMVVQQPQAAIVCDVGLAETKIIEETHMDMDEVLSEVSSNSRLSIDTKEGAEILEMDTQDGQDMPDVKQSELNISEEAQMPQFPANSPETVVAAGVVSNFDITKTDIKFEVVQRTVECAMSLMQLNRDMIIHKSNEKMLFQLVQDEVSPVNVATDNNLEAIIDDSKSDFVESLISVDTDDGRRNNDAQPDMSSVSSGDDIGAASLVQGEGVGTDLLVQQSQQAIIEPVAEVNKEDTITIVKTSDTIRSAAATGGTIKKKKKKSKHSPNKSEDTKLAEGREVTITPLKLNYLENSSEQRLEPETKRSSQNDLYLQKLARLQAYYDTQMSERDENRAAFKDSQASSSKNKSKYHPSTVTGALSSSKKGNQKSSSHKDDHYKHKIFRSYRKSTDDDNDGDNDRPAFSRASSLGVPTATIVSGASSSTSTTTKESTQHQTDSNTTKMVFQQEDGIFFLPQDMKPPVVVDDMLTSSCCRVNLDNLISRVRTKTLSPSQSPAKKPKTASADTDANKVMKVRTDNSKAVTLAKKSAVSVKKVANSTDLPKNPSLISDEKGSILANFIRQKSPYAATVIAAKIPAKNAVLEPTAGEKTNAETTRSSARNKKVMPTTEDAAKSVSDIATTVTKNKKVIASTSAKSRDAPKPATSVKKVEQFIPIVNTVAGKKISERLKSTILAKNIFKNNHMIATTVNTSAGEDVELEFVCEQGLPPANNNNRRFKHLLRPSMQDKSSQSSSSDSETDDVCFFADDDPVHEECNSFLEFYYRKYPHLKEPNVKRKRNNNIRLRPKRMKQNVATSVAPKPAAPPAPPPPPPPPPPPLALEPAPAVAAATATKKDELKRRNQFYTSDDLYKPRRARGSRSRRRGDNVDGSKDTGNKTNTD